MSEYRERVVVIGAGIVGVCCASFVQRLGRQVVLVDRLPPGPDGAPNTGRFA